MAKAETTTSYRWDEHQLIRRIDVRQQSNGQAVAYLYANPEPTLQQNRNDLRAALRLKGWGTLSDHRGGEFALRVSGLQNGQELVDFLTHDGIVTGPPQVNSATQSPEASKGYVPWIKARSLQASGIMYSIGNAIYLTSGILRSKANGKVDSGQISSALLWGAGDALVATVGKHDDSRQFISLLGKLKSHYEKEGIEIPGTSAIYVETSKAGKTPSIKAYDWVREHVNQIKCASEVAAAVGYYKAGQTQNNIWKQRTAVIFGLGFLSSLLIPERKIDEEKYAQTGPLGRFWMKIQSNPLTVGGVSGYSNTVFTTIGAMNERKAQQALGAAGNKIYRWDFAAPGVMFFGNSLYAMSKKTTGGDIKGDAMVSDVYTVAAQIINKQPDALREQAIESTARFLGERPEIPGAHSEVIARLREEIDIQRKNPWFEQKGLPPYQPQPTKPRVHLAEATHHDAVNDNDTVTKIPQPQTTLAAANDREHAAMHATQGAQII